MRMNITFQRDAWNRLLATVPGDGQPIAVEPVRCFPLTHPDEQISLLDANGHEVLRISSLNELPAEQREAFVLNELEEKSFREIAEEKGVSINTLLSRKLYAILAMRKKLQRLYDEL